MKKITILLILTCFLFSCSNDNSETEKSGKKTIVTTTGILADCVKKMVGSDVEVISLMGPGVDPHLYKAVQGDLAKLENADVIIYNGLHLEGKMAEVLEKLARIKPVYALSDGIEKTRLRQIENSDVYDPHIWFDVKIWRDGLSFIEEKLKTNFPESKDSISTRSATYFTELDSLDIYVRNSVMEIPNSQRVLITAHDAFHYFGNAYGVEVRGLQGISTLSQAGLKDVKDLSDLILTKNIKALFVETSVSHKQLEAVVQNCKDKGHQISIGGTLYSDALGEKNSGADTYTSMVKYNVETIVKGLK